MDTRSVHETAIVEGESALEILNILLKMQHGVSSDGMATMRLELPIEELAPLSRALMRVEAELLLEDAENWSGSADARTDEQRRFDAFEVLTHRTCDALREAGTAEPVI